MVKSMEHTVDHMASTGNVGKSDAIMLHAGASVHNSTLDYTEEQLRTRERALRILEDDLSPRALSTDSSARLRSMLIALVVARNPSTRHFLRGGAFRRGRGGRPHTSLLACLLSTYCHAHAALLSKVDGILAAVGIARKVLPLSLIPSCEREG